MNSAVLAVKCPKCPSAFGMGFWIEGSQLEKLAKLERAMAIGVCRFTLSRCISTCFWLSSTCTNILSFWLYIPYYPTFGAFGKIYDCSWQGFLKSCQHLEFLLRFSVPWLLWGHNSGPSTLIFPDSD